MWHPLERWQRKTKVRAAKAKEEEGLHCSPCEVLEAIGWKQGSAKMQGCLDVSRGRRTENPKRKHVVQH